MCVDILLGCMSMWWCSLELGFHAVVSYQVGSRNWSWVLRKHSHSWATSPGLGFVISLYWYLKVYPVPGLEGTLLAQEDIVRLITWCLRPPLTLPYVARTSLVYLGDSYSYHQHINLIYNTVHRIPALGTQRQVDLCEWVRGQLGLQSKYRCAARASQGNNVKNTNKQITL